MLTRFVILALAAFLIQPCLAQTCTLTSEDVKKRVLEANSDLQLVELQNQVADLQVRQAKSVYDSRLTFDINHEIDKNEPLISVFGSRNDLTNIGSSISKEFSTGTQLGAGYLTTRQFTNSPFTVFNPAYDSRWFFSLRQSLLSNAFGKSQNLGILVAESNAEAIRAQNQYTQDQIVFSALENYWNWSAAVEDKTLAQQASERAKEFLSTTQKLLKYGTVEKSDLYAAQSNLEASMEDILATDQREKSLFLSLKTKMRSFDLQPCQAPRPSIPESQPLDSLIQKSLASREDYQSLKKKLEADNYRVSSAKWAKIPSLDLVSRLELNQVDADWSTSAVDAFDTSHTDFFIGAEIRIPLENKSGKSTYLLAKVQKTQTQTEIQKIEDQIRYEVEETSKSLETTKERILKNINILELERKKLDAARKEYNVGRESAFTILSYQQNLIAAERKLLALETSRNILIETLRLVTSSDIQ